MEQLDRDMEAYMAAAPRISENDIRMAIDDSGGGGGGSGETLAVVA